MAKKSNRIARMRFPSEKRLQQRNERLLARLKAGLPALETLLQEVNSRFYSDGFYRFYHQSFKVYGLQTLTKEMVSAFKRHAARKPLNQWFLQIVAEGTEKRFQLEDNKRWLEVTRPIVEAFLHARYFLEMICHEAKTLKEAPVVLPSGWAAVLHLYNQR